jgi:1-phosphofructokinase family hexose kinase
VLLVLSPNLCVDRVVVVPDFAPGRVHRARAVHVLASGKGMNVARAARALGVEATVVGAVGDDATGRWFVTDARRRGIALRAVRGRGATRTCTVIVAPGLGETVVNEPGPQVDARTADLLRRRVRRLRGQASVLVLTGSLPPGLPATFYRDAIAEAPGRPTVLDTGGEALRQAVAAAPTVLKVNRDELAALVGRDLIAMGDVVAAAREVPVRDGVVVTLGQAGAVLVRAGRAWMARPPEVRRESAVGAGDSLAAGLAAALLAGQPLVDALRLGVAVAAADVATLLPGTVERAEVDRLLPLVAVEPLGAA